MKYILSIDQGTTGSTAALISLKDFKFIGHVSREFPQHYPHPGWVEHNLNDIWKSVEKTVKEALRENNVKPSEIECIGITNQRETTCAFDREGSPLCNAIVWQDRRTSEYCKQNKNFEKDLKKLTGLPLDPYFSATKMMWMLKNVDKVKDCKSKDLHFSTIETFLIYKLTEGNSFVTETSNASRTQLMNLETGKWDPKLCEHFGVSIDSLPKIKDSFGEFGKTKGLNFLPDGIPITGVLGDQQAALFGQACSKKGDMKCTYGTGAFILVNTGVNIVRSKAGLLSTSAYQYKGKQRYALEGASYIAGAAVQWLRDNLGIIKNSAEVEDLANKVKDLSEMENILFMPYFSGIGSPHWVPEAKACVLGLTRDSKDSHLARACLEGIALSINDLIIAMDNDSDFELTELRVDGGAVKDDLLMNIQASTSNLEIVRPEVIETTAYGAALGAAVGIEAISLEDVNQFWRKDKTFKPNPEWIDFYIRKKEKWDHAVKRLFL